MEIIQAVTPIIIKGLSFKELLAIWAASKVMGLFLFVINISQIEWKNLKQTKSKNEEKASKQIKKKYKVYLFYKMEMIF